MTAVVFCSVLLNQCDQLVMDLKVRLSSHGSFTIDNEVRRKQNNSKIDLHATCRTHFFDRLKNSHFVMLTIYVIKIEELFLINDIFIRKSNFFLRLNHFPTISTSEE